jgi:hypothetical protein
VSYAIVTYGLVLAGVLGYAAHLARVRRRLAAELRTRFGSNRG